ncbi:NAD(P)-dependent oxidoreductase [Oceaniferula spumae]|uniref:NAD(P)-dependent oxidoreductase n=1 Tax=Oceaniferula spumae TaxID=2979115 RepID=A0AAT9FM98_9BACT
MPNKSKKESDKQLRPAQNQDRQPGRESEMEPLPEYENPDLKGSDRLKGKVALITGGDSGIGRAIAVAFAREGADVAIVYIEEDADAKKTAELVSEKGRTCLNLKCDISKQKNCEKAVNDTVEKFGRLDVLINNAAEQHPQDSISEISEKQLKKTFETNVYPLFYFTQAALLHLEKSGSGAIINSTSVTAYRGSPHLLDYSATKGAIVSFTRSLAGGLAQKKIRVNAVAPGPIWTPLIPATFSPDQVAEFGADTPLERAGHPWECAECYLFLAGAESSYITGQVIHPNGGEIVNG